MNIMMKLYLHQNKKQLEKTLTKCRWKSEEATHYTIIMPFYFKGKHYKRGEIVLFTEEQLELMKVMLPLDKYIEVGETYDHYRESAI